MNIAATAPYRLLDPTSETSAVMRERLAPPTDLRGKTIGLLSIAKPRSAEYLDQVERRLVEAGLHVARFEKPTFTKPAPEHVLEAVLDGCDVVVEALAD